MGAVIVVGSVNRDLTLVVERAPGPGETALSTLTRSGWGGKGANQAVAAARLGAHTSLLAAVGSDDLGREAVANLDFFGLDTSLIAVLDGHTTGMAFIILTADGQNRIVVAPGANMSLDPGQTVAALTPRLGRDVVVVMQAEIPQRVVDAVAAASRDAGARVVLNQAPFRPISPQTRRLCDPLVVNAGEAAALWGQRITGTAEARQAAAALGGLSRSLVITLGSEGAVISAGGGARHIPAPAVTAVDTTGAGDAFTGALAAALAEGVALADAAEHAVAAAAISVTRLGTHESYPTKDEVAPMRE